jgi:hypothetical protein
MGAVVGILVYANWKKDAPHDTMPAERQQILLERIKKAAKLITIEGEYNNVHEYKDYYWSDISMFRKKALIKVQAKVSVGFDLSKATFEADSLQRIIRVRNLPAPEILSIDHNVQYYDLTQGMFQSFSNEDLTAINTVIKQKLRDSITVSPLMEQAKTSGLETLDIIRVLVEQGGWTFEMVQDSLLPKQKPLLRVDSIKG